MPTIPEHPEIACALATGYPKPPIEADPVYCSECSREMYGDETVFVYDGETLCENCCRDRIMEDIDMSEIARKLGFIVKPANQFVERD